MTSDLLDVEEAAAFLHVKSATVRSWILKSQIPFVKLGRRVFLRRKNLEELIASSVVPARQPFPGAEPVAAETR
jgi:excisionase family DNA binding protein